MILAEQSPKANAPPLTWERCVELEPLLARLKSIVARCDVPRHLDGYWWKWHVFERTAEQLAGYRAINPALRTNAAWFIVHDHLLDVFQRRAAEIAEAQS